MKKRSALVGFMALAIAGAFSCRAENCSLTINDGAGVISSPAPLQEIANEIADRGGDPKIVTVAHVDGTLEQYAKGIVKQCQSWQSASGGIKNNLVVFAVAPKQHVFGIFYGSELKGPLDGSVAAIKSQFMVPAFKDGDFARGILRGEEQVSQHMQAFNTAALHPQQVSTTVNNQATDLSGFWTFLFWILGLGAVGFAIWAIYTAVQNSKRNKAAIRDAQQEAQKVAAMVAERIASLSASVEEKAALGEDVLTKKKSLWAISEEYSKVAGSESFNPNADGFTAGQYETMGRYYRQLMLRLDAAEAGIPSRTAEEAVRKSAYVPGIKDRTSPFRRPTNRSTPTVTHTTTVINSGPSYIPVPVIVEDAPSYRSDPDPEPSRSSSYSSSRDDDSGSSFGGSSSSWSSSSSSDSGSSSSWSDSSSSSSDFGGGGDSSF